MDISIIFIIINLFLMEALLSVDNAAVLAVMVSGLPPEQRQKALRYGIIGAYVFRGLCLLIASFLVKYSILKVLGGLYLLYLSFKSLKGGDDHKSVSPTRAGFWGTVAMVEFMDIVFSIDNIFAAVALSDKFWVIAVGVGMGILAMRFVAGKFVKLMEKYPSLAKSAYIVILLLGLKLIIDGLLPYLHAKGLKTILESHLFDTIFSICMMVIFFFPLVRPKRSISTNI